MFSQGQCMRVRVDHTAACGWYGYRLCMYGRAMGRAYRLRATGLQLYGPPPDEPIGIAAHFVALPPGFARIGF
eukprot:4547710-Prymnesium_polylepis.1